MWNVATDESDAVASVSGILQKKAVSETSARASREGTASQGARHALHSRPHLLALVPHVHGTRNEDALDAI
jgi:hypothetical protein